MKKIGIIFFIMLTSIFTTSCSDSKEINNDNGEETKETFNKNAQTALAIVQSQDNKTNVNFYSINDKLIYGFHYNNSNKELEYSLNQNIENLNFVDGQIVQFGNKYYLTIEGKRYCAIKEFDKEEISVYDINEKMNCHIPYTVSGDITMSVISKNLYDDTNYESGAIANDYVYLIASNNIIDNKSYKYSWYRNDTMIQDSNLDKYIIANDYEDAEYYVELTTNDGQIFKSEPIHVKIDRS